MVRTCGLVLAVAATILTAGFKLLAQQQPQPAPIVDRVGFPDNYQTEFVPLFAFDRPDNGQIRVVYGNHAVTNTPNGKPFAYGSVIVMETYRARRDSQNNLVKDATGRYIRDQLNAIFVMRKERGFGSEYEHNRTGEWEYVAFRPDRTYQTQPRDSWSCANCHLMATATRDWVFRPNLIYDGVDSKGAVPDGVMSHYLFFPAAIRVRAGSFVTWLNDDEVDHQIVVTAPARVTGPVISTGEHFRARFNSTGEYDVVCAIHPTMRARVTVDP